MVARFCRVPRSGGAGGGPESEAGKPGHRDVLRGYPQNGADAGEVGDVVHGRIDGPAFGCDPHQVRDVLPEDLLEEGLERHLQAQDNHHFGCALGDLADDVLHPGLEAAVPLVCPLDWDDLLESDAGPGGLGPQQLQVLLTVVIVAGEDDDPVPPELPQQLQYDRDLLLCAGDGAESNGEESGVAQDLAGGTVGNLEATGRRKKILLG